MRLGGFEERQVWRVWPVEMVGEGEHLSNQLLLSRQGLLHCRVGGIAPTHDLVLHSCGN